MAGPRSAAEVPFLLIGGYDVLGQVTDLTHSVEALTEESHCLGDAWVENMYVGVRRSTINQNGFYDDGVGSRHEALMSGLATSRVLCYGLEGTATGEGFVAFSGALEVTYNRTVSRGALTKANANYVNSGLVEEGKIVRTLKAASASGIQGTAIDNAASSTGSTNFGLPGGAGSAYLQVTSLDAAASGIIKLTHSSDDITYADLVTFTGFTSLTVPMAERKPVTTTAIERYVRPWLDFTTPGAGASCTYFVGLVRGPLPA